MKNSRPKISEVIIVEGKFDQLKLNNIIDAVIITTNGFRIAGQPEKLEQIKQLAKLNGIILLTDSDAAGFAIRALFCKIIPQKYIKHAYIPVVHGKEPRKKMPSKAGYLGVEGVDEQILINALKKAGATFVDQKPQINTEKITNLTLFADGLIGKPCSKIKRQQLLFSLNLPPNISTKNLIRFLNTANNFEFYKTALQNIN